MEEIRAEYTVHTASGASRAVADECFCCTSSPCPPRPDRTPVTLRYRSCAQARRSCRGLHIRKIFPLKLGRPAGVSRHVQRPALPCRDAVPDYILCDIRGSLAGRSILPDLAPSLQRRMSTLRNEKPASSEAG